MHYQASPVASLAHASSDDLQTTIQRMADCHGRGYKATEGMFSYM